MSSRGASGSADSGTTRSVPMMAIAARTTLRAKTERQLQNSSRVPEASTPRTALAPATPAQILTALVRSAAVKVPVIVDSVAGMTRAAPDTQDRAERDQLVAPSAVIATAEPTPKITRPISRVSRRPNRSPIAPAGSSSAAKHSE